MPLPFEEVEFSDLDSISITSTAPSDEEAEYSVEKINAEEMDAEGVMKYLVKWEGYPLHLSTWEPVENLISETILPAWEKEKEEIRSGRKVAFDVDEFYEAQETQMEEKAQRHHRRVAKRKRLGLPVSRSGSISNGSANDVTMRDDSGGSEEDQEEDQSLATRQKRVKTVIPKRKGVALKVKKGSNRQAAVASFNNGEISDDDGSSSDEMFIGDNRTEKRVQVNGQSPDLTRAAPSTTAQPPTTSAPSNATTPRRAASSNKASSTSKSVAARTSATSSSSASIRPPANPLPSSSARKSAPSTASLGSSNITSLQKLPVLPTDPSKRKSTGNVAINFKPRPGPKARKMSESDPRHQRFANLSEQNRFHKHAAKEAAPDPSMLSTFNFLTGRYEQPVATASRTIATAPPSTRPIPSVFGRREAPAPVRQRSVSPSSPREPFIPTAPSDNTTIHHRVCWDWRNGKCTKPECSFAHHYITCPFWRKGSCFKEEKDCKYDHREGRDPILALPRGPSNPMAFVPHNNPTRQLPLHQTSEMTVPFHGNAPATQKHSSTPGPSIIQHPRMTRPLVETLLYLSDIVCPDWYAGHCLWERSCRLAHRDTGCHIDFKDVTCSFWLKGSCNKPESTCKFAHSLKEYRAGIPGSGEILFVPSAVDPSNTPNANALNGAAIQRPQLRESNAVDTMMIDEDHGHGVVHSPLEKSPAFRQPSLSVQKPANGSAYVHNIDLAVRAEGSEFEIAAKLVCFTEQDGTMSTEILGSQRRLEMKHFINAADLKSWCAGTLQQGARFPTGDVQVERPSNVRLEEMLQVSCGVALSSDFTILIYPAAAQEWDFLSRAGDAKSQAALRFKLLPPLPTEVLNKVASIPKVTPDVCGTAVDGTDDTSSLLTAKHLLNANMQRLLQVSDIRTEDRVFIMMPESRTPEIKLIVEAFEQRFKQPDYKDRKWKIWTSQKASNWNTCMEASACLVILHPGVHLWDVHRLGKVLHQTSFRFFSIAFDPALAILNQSDPTFSCQLLFPMGDVVFITDDVFIHMPWKVLSIIERVNRDNAGKPYGATRNKIATRPGIKSWVMDLVRKQEEGKEDPRLTMLLVEIFKLCPIEKEDEQYPGNPSEKSDLISLAPELLPTYPILLQTDRAKATDYLVNWFAGWSFMNASKFRRFTVCHEEPGTGTPGMDKNYNLVMQGAQADPRGWGNEYKYLLVKTPDQWIEWNEAKGKKKR